MANIQKYLDDIRKALFGREVRSSIHDAIEAINKEVEGTTSKQENLDATFQQLIINAGNSNAEVVAARVEADGTPHNTLGERLNAMDKRDFANKVIVNVKKYEDLVYEKNGVNAWDLAFAEGFKELKNGGILVIPEGDYYIDTRVTLENKDGITILCGGTLKPLNGQTALIGTLTLKNITNSTIQSLKFDGNKNNINPPNAVGMESLIQMDNCSNIVFNNFTAENISLNALNSNEGLKNVVFNNAIIKNCGEHGFYFGGDGVSNIRFNNLYVENIGTSQLCANRSVACVKFRNKNNTQSKHDQIVIDGFKFIMNTPPVQTYDRQLVQAYDVKNITIRNGEISAQDGSIFATNISLDNMVIDNVDLDGRRVCYGINKKTGWDNAEDILVPGEFNISILNSKLHAYNDYTTDISMYSNCYIDFKDSQYRTTLATETNVDVTFENCSINLGGGRFNLSLTKGFNIKFLNVKFNYPINRVQPIISVASGDSSVLTFDNVEALIDTNTFCQGGENITLNITDSVINASLSNSPNSASKYKEVYISNTRIKGYILDKITEKLSPNNIMHLDGSRKDFKIYRKYIARDEAEIRIDLTNQRCADIKKDNIMLSNDLCMRFKYEIENNSIVVITPERMVDEHDTTFTIIYAYQN